jgi:hypothetical protein
MISIEDIIDFYKIESADRSLSTYTTMKYNLVRLQKILRKDINDIVINDFRPISKIILVLDKYALNTRIQTIMGIKLFLKYKEANEKVIDEYNNLLKDLCIESKVITEKNEMTPNEVKNWIDYTELKEKVINFFNTDFKKYEGKEDFSVYIWDRNFLLLCLYTLLPPTRIGNYQYMRIRQQKKRKATSLDNKNNYIMVNDNGSFTFVFNQYKTSKYIGQIEHIITKEKNPILCEIMTKYLKVRERYVNNQKNDILFINKEKKEMTQSNITDTLKYITRKIVNKELSVNLLRHIFITSFLEKSQSIEDKKNVATFMGQTYNPTMMETYNKLKKKIKPPSPPIVVSFD